MAIKSYKYRIYPSKRQTQTLNNQLAICCELYNAALQERRDAWHLERKSISRFDQIYQLPDIRANRTDVAAIHSDVLQDAITRIDKAFKAFFRRVKTKEKAGYPRFHSFRRYDSITFRQVGNVFDGNKLRISKVGQVRIKLHRPIGGAIKTMTIKRQAGRWFAIFACEYIPERLPFNPNMVGVDVGLTTFATLSDGTAIANPRYYQKAQAKLRVAQRRVARRKKGSRGRRDAVTLLQRAHVHVQAQRQDFHHRISRWIVNNYGLIAVENLNTKGLARGMLAKSVNDAGWGQWFGFTSYKAADAGRLYLKVTPSGTSQECICGTNVPKTLSQRWHQCNSCGVSGSRDHISAQVILGRAIRLYAPTSPAAECVA